MVSINKFSLTYFKLSIIIAVITGSANTTVNFPEGQQGCINMAEVLSILPSPTSTLYVVWPSTDGSDCICPFCNDVTAHCFLRDCHCYNTSFAPQLVSNASDSPTLCWPTFSNHNGTDIYFYTEERSCSNVPNPRGPLLTQTYVYTARLLERG